MINFSTLPTDKPNNLPETGTYYATITSAEMKQGLDTTKAPYLNMVLSLRNKDGKSCGRIYDILTESEKEAIQYKLARFLLALGLDKLGTFELADLVKVIKNKELIVVVKQEEPKNGYAAKTVVNIFDDGIYYPMSDATEIFGAATTQVTNDTDDDDLRIDASDAVDVHATDDDDF